MAPKAIFLVFTFSCNIKNKIFHDPWYSIDYDYGDDDEADSIDEDM